MKVLTLSLFQASTESFGQITILFEDGVHVVGFIAESGYNFRSEFFQNFKAAVQLRADPGADPIWDKWEDRTLNPVKDLHTGLRDFVLSSLPDLLMVGYTVTGSYEYEDEIWQINPPQTIETVDLPDLDL